MGCAMGGDMCRLRLESLEDAVCRECEVSCGCEEEEVEEDFEWGAISPDVEGALQKLFWRRLSEGLSGF